MFAISPAILYYTRYIRDEPFMLLFLVWLVLMIFRYFDTRQSKYLIVMMVPYALMFSSMEISYIFAAFIGFFLLYALLDLAHDLDAKCAEDSFLCGPGGQRGGPRSTASTR